MCGIGGISVVNAKPVDFWEKNAKTLSLLLEHRGPDDEGYLLLSNSENPTAVGAKTFPEEEPQYLPKKHLLETIHPNLSGMLIHKRLSIIGLGYLGHQPMCDTTGRYWIVFNGEIFNYLELQKTYSLKNKSQTDTEILVQLWALMQEKCLHLLDGFFAFCIYDSLANSYTVVRDKTGVKPIYFVKNNDLFAFASEEQPLRHILGNFNLNNQAVMAHLKMGLTDIFPWFDEIQTLNAGHFVQWFPNSNEFKIDQWFNPYSELNASLKNKYLQELLTESVRIRLRSDVRLGFAVSGGIDSAILVGLARKLLGEDMPLHLFSVASNNLPGDESNWQKMVVEKNGGIHHRILVEDFESELLPKMVSFTNRAPVAWNNLAHFSLCETVRKSGITVLFNGQGADELFGGYPDYFIQSYYQEKKFLSKYKKNWPIESSEAFKFYLKRRLRNGISDNQLQRIDKNLWGNMLTDLTLNSGMVKLHPAVENVQEMMMGDYYGNLVNPKFYGKLHQMLAWEDRNGMAFQLESRNPFADDLKIPQKYLGKFALHELMDGGKTKGVLREAFKELLPIQLYNRTDKKGFSVPEDFLTRKHGLSWTEAVMNDDLDKWVKRDYRQKIIQNFSALNSKELQRYFRIASLGYYLAELKNERK